MEDTIQAIYKFCEKRLIKRLSFDDMADSDKDEFIAEWLWALDRNTACETINEALLNDPFYFDTSMLLYNGEAYKDHAKEKAVTERRLIREYFAKHYEDEIECGVNQLIEEEAVQSGKELMDEAFPALKELFDNFQCSVDKLFSRGA